VQKLFSLIRSHLFIFAFISVSSLIAVAISLTSAAGKTGQPPVKE